MNAISNFDEIHEYFELPQSTTGFSHYGEKTYIRDDNSVVVQNLATGKETLLQNCVNRRTAHLTLELFYNNTLNSLGVCNKLDKVMRLANYGKSSLPQVI